MLTPFSTKLSNEEETSRIHKPNIIYVYMEREGTFKGEETKWVRRLVSSKAKWTNFW